VIVLTFSICHDHRISFPAYAIEPQWWQTGVPKNEMSFFFLPFPILSGVGTTCFSSCCDKDSAIIFTTGRLPDVSPPWECRWNVINFQKWCSLFSILNGSFSRIWWHANKWLSISFSHWQCPSDGDFSFPCFVGILILSLWSRQLNEFLET
jgi:hypothetical protein